MMEYLPGQSVFPQVDHCTISRVHMHRISVTQKHTTGVFALLLI